MRRRSEAERRVRAVYGLQDARADPGFEIALAAELRRNYSPAVLMELYQSHSGSGDYIAGLLRRCCFRALARHCGQGVTLGVNVSLRHPETFEIGDGVFVGDLAAIHGRHDGRCRIGRKVWIGPQSFLDARDLEIGDYVGWGPGAKVLGSMHCGDPVDLPVIQTDLEISPVRVEDWADIGVNAVLLPGVTIGKGAIVGAGAVVTADVPPFSKVAGAPARVIGWRRIDQCPSDEARYPEAAECTD